MACACGVAINVVTAVAKRKKPEQHKHAITSASKYFEKVNTGMSSTKPATELCVSKRTVSNTPQGQGGQTTPYLSKEVETTPYLLSKEVKTTRHPNPHISKEVKVPTKVPSLNLEEVKRGPPCSAQTAREMKKASSDVYSLTHDPPKYTLKPSVSSAVTSRDPPKYTPRAESARRNDGSATTRSKQHIPRTGLGGMQMQQQRLASSRRRAR